LAQKISKSKIFLTIIENLKPKYILSLIFTFSCQNISIEKNIPMNWTEFDLDMPQGIVVMKGENKKLPLKAWVAKINLNSPDIQVRVLSSSDKDRKNTPMEFLNQTDARIVINGGYFRSGKDPAQHVGLLKTSGILEEPASHSVYRDSEKYFITRGAFGISNDGLPDIAWSSTNNDSIFEWALPQKNRPGNPSKYLDFKLSSHWDMRDAIHAGPILVHSNKINITVEEEVFFNTPVAGIQPRSAIGYSKEGYLIMMVVDGRQADSRGVYLEELAIMMMEFNCDEAINLDGGGSSCMVADNRLLNRPIGRNIQREIMSAIGVFYGN
tara:strand:+ start:738 stop:1712 length:975 start_codon:yes stop_codon:yes gene_type:complete